MLHHVRSYFWWGGGSAALWPKRGKEGEGKRKEKKGGERGKRRRKGRKEREGKIKSKRKKLPIIGSGQQKQNTK